MDPQTPVQIQIWQLPAGIAVQLTKEGKIAFERNGMDPYQAESYISGLTHDLFLQPPLPPVVPSPEATPVPLALQAIENEPADLTAEIVELNLRELRFENKTRTLEISCRLRDYVGTGANYQVSFFLVEVGADTTTNEAIPKESLKGIFPVISEEVAFPAGAIDREFSKEVTIPAKGRYRLVAVIFKKERVGVPEIISYCQGAYLRVVD